MRVLLRPVLVPELGLVVLKPGRESIQIFHNPRVLVEPEPKSMRNLPSGVVPAVRQSLAEDKTLLPFFSNERVIRAAVGGGAIVLEPGRGLRRGIARRLHWRWRQRRGGHCARGVPAVLR